MTPEEYQRLKDAEKEHLKKLKELKQAVRVLERQKKIQSELEKMSRTSDDALQAQSEAVERLAMETALHEARLDVAMDSAEPTESAPRDDALETELRSARAQALVERMKQSMADSDDAAGGRNSAEEDIENPTGEASARKEPAERSEKPIAPDGKGLETRTPRTSPERASRKSPKGPSEQTTETRPEKTIGRM